MSGQKDSDPVAALNARAAREGWGLRCHRTLEFDRPELNTMRDLWWAKAHGRRLPKRGDFDARTLKPFLPNISIVERVEESGGSRRYRFRLFGTALTRFVGEQTSRFLEDLVPPANLLRWTLSYDAVLAAGAPLRFTARYEMPRISYLTGESFSAPLADEDGARRLIIAATYMTPRQAALTA